MYGVAVEYSLGGDGLLDPLLRHTCRALLVSQPGYRRRLALMGDGWQRVVDLFLFSAPEAALAALSGDPWQTFVLAHPACRQAAPALLVSERWGEVVVLLRQTVRRGSGQACWRDHLTVAAPESVLW